MTQPGDLEAHVDALEERLRVLRARICGASAELPPPEAAAAPRGPLTILEPEIALALLEQLVAEAG